MLTQTFERSQLLAGQQWILLDSFDSAQNERMLHELRARIRELEERNQELEACARMVAHDLKTPLCVVMGLATTLRQDYARLSADEQHMCFDNLVRAASKMNNIIDELMLLARLRDAKAVTRPLDMAAVVAEAQSRLAHMIHDSQAEIRLPDAWPTAEGYGPWVEEVWVNYISNAIKYGGMPSAPPHIELGGETRPDGTVHFWIHDSGPGISPDDQARLFQPFSQLNPGRADGHGLGLWVVRHIVEKLDGQVGVTSVQGQGSTFSFTLPAASGQTPKNPGRQKDLE